MPKESTRPKRALGPYNFFIKDRRSHYKANNISISFSDFSKECSSIWKSLSIEEKDKYSKSVEEDKARYQSEMASYTPETKGKKRKSKDPNQPKRSLSAFFFFCHEARPKLRAENPGATISELAKKLGAKWQLLSDEEKAPFAESAQKDKERYAREMELFRNDSSSLKKGAKSVNQLEPDDSSSES